MRRILLWMAGNASLRRWVPRLWFARRAVRRFMPGEDLDAAVTAGAAYEADGIVPIYTRLGENLRDLEEARATTEHYLELLDRMRTTSSRGELSVKLTQIGFDLDVDETLANAERLADRAAAMGTDLWVDMESSRYVDGTLELMQRLRERHPNVGVCLQSYLHRTAGDVQRLLRLGIGVRLVKGAYAEPPEAAYQERHEVDANYLALAVTMVQATAAGRGVRLGLGTHDVRLIEQVAAHAAAMGVPRTGFEVQMLYGIRTDEQRRLAREGYLVRTLVAYGPAWYAWYLRRLAERPANVIFALRQALP